ncbi:MAG: hypothetical protein GC149_20355 [Gammaproteobacteria bacterium]|nr:hypothetical protein [Gammaproteobacteria bacterium]
MAVYPQFENRAVRDEEASVKAGREVLKDEDWVVLVIDQNTQIPKRVEHWLKQIELDVINGRMTSDLAGRYKAMYDHWKAGKEIPLEGMDIRQWPQATRATAENLIRQGIRTVEDLAEAPEAILQRIGAGARDLQSRAKAYLEASDGKAAEEILSLKETIENQNILIKDLQKTIADLQAQLEGKGGENTDATADGGGTENSDLAAAVSLLNQDDESHWNKNGDPDLTVLTELTGRRVTRAEVEKAFPDLKRQQAA